MNNKTHPANTVTAIRLLHDDGALVIVGDESDNWTVTDDDGSHRIDSEHTISGADITLLESITSVVSWRMLADVLITVFKESENARAMSVFEIMYVCMKMMVLKTRSMSDTTRKYVYKGLIEEAATFKNKTIRISGATKK